MTLQEVLISLLQQLSHGKHSANISYDEVRHWPNGALSLLLTESLIESINPTDETVCTGCHETCLKPVRTLVGQFGQPPRYFVACDENDYMGKIPVQPYQIQQWRITDKLLAVWLAHKLGMRPSEAKGKNSAETLIGHWEDNQNRYPLALDFAEVLSLKLEQNSIPLSEILYAQEGAILVDLGAVRSLAKHSSSASSKSLYQPSTLKRGMRKRNTADLHASWLKAYREIKRKHPTKSDSWIASQIAKMEIAQGRDVETIRKNMKR